MLDFRYQSLLYRDADLGVLERQALGFHNVSNGSVSIEM